MDRRALGYVLILGQLLVTITVWCFYGALLKNRIAHLSDAAWGQCDAVGTVVYKLWKDL